jgi:DNA-binding NarL/FixJ family response regulator
MNLTQNGSGSPSGDKHSIRSVMIVDDHELFRHGLSHLINTIEGLNVVAEAGTCEEALSILQIIPLDVIVLDLSLPDGNAISILQHLQQRPAPPAVIILSATLNDDLLMQAMLTGASGYLTKDMSATEIATILHRFQQGELALASQIASRLIRLLVQKNHEVETAYRLQTLTLNATASTPSTPAFSEGPSPTTSKSLQAPSLLGLLTPQEEKIYQLMKLGKTNKQIAGQLAISHFTVGKHVQNILHKLRVMNRTQAVSYTAFEGGIERE